MSNNVYPKCKTALMNKELDFDTDTLQIALIDGADYVYSAAHADYGADVPAGAKVADVAMTSPDITSVDGTLDSAGWTWALVTGDVSEEIILYDGTHANDQLIANYDTGMTGMPVTPNGGDINGAVHASGWFAL